MFMRGRKSSSKNFAPDKKLLRRWLAGWQAAAEFHTKEIRRATPATRFAQLVVLTQFTERYCQPLMTRERARAVEQVRRRWNKLKNAHRHATVGIVAATRPRNGRGRKAV
jgi:hypothetical protein